MNQIVRDLTFTVETMDMFDDSSIPTLDFNLKLSYTQGTPTLLYKFCSKPMAWA